MAFRAFLITIGSMNFVISKVRRVGCMSSVAGGAVHFGQEKTFVFRYQAGTSQIMAAGAQYPGLIPESHGGVSTVGIMTFQTVPLGKRIVNMGAFLLSF